MAPYMSHLLNIRTDTNFVAKTTEATIALKISLTGLITWKNSAYHYSNTLATIYPWRLVDIYVYCPWLISSNLKITNWLTCGLRPCPIICWWLWLWLNLFYHNFLWLNSLMWHECIFLWWHHQYFRLWSLLSAHLINYYFEGICRWPLVKEP